MLMLSNDSCAMVIGIFSDGEISSGSGDGGLKEHLK